VQGWKQDRVLSAKEAAKEIGHQDLSFSGAALVARQQTYRVVQLAICRVRDLVLQAQERLHMPEDP